MTAVTCRDSGDTANIDAAAMVKRIDANWTAGNNGGGLDTGTAGGAAIYYIWAIDDSTGTNPGDFLFSLSSTTPTMPGGYDVKRVLGGRRWSGSAWDTFRTSGNGPVRWVQVLEPPQVYNDSLTGPSFHDVDCSAYLPAGLATRAQVPFAVDGDAEVHVRAVGTTAGPGVPTFFLDGSTADGDQAFAEVALDGSGVFQVTLTNGSGGESVVINLWAYEESL
jgi:hypothetical protein